MTTADSVAIEQSLSDPGAFAVIFDRHASSIHRFLARRVEPADADSLLGDVFRIAFERRATFDVSQPSSRPWLYGIATNLVARHRRSEGRRLRAMAELASRRVVDQQEVDAVGEQTTRRLDAAQQWTVVADAIDHLPDVERDTLLLLVWEELSYEDIAAALGVPVGTVRSRLNRARRRLGALDRMPARKGSPR